MGNNAQEREERFYLGRFLEALQLEFDVVQRGADPPDFILTLAGKHTSVEMTEFHSGARGDNGLPRRAVEEEWRKFQRLFESAREQYADLNHIMGLAFFKALEVPPRREQMPFAKELLEFGHQKLPYLTKDGSDFSQFGSSSPLLGKYLKRLRLWDAGCFTSWEWNHMAAGVGLTERELLDIILPKIKVGRPKETNENWLLMVSGHQLSQSIGLPHVDVLREYGELNKALTCGPYDRVYIFQYMFGRVLLWQLAQGWMEVKGAKFAANRSGS